MRPTEFIDNEISPKDSTHDPKIDYIRALLGEEINVEKIKFFLHGADGNVEIAVNHLLNELEKESSSGALTPSVEMVLSEVAEEVKCPLCLSYLNKPVALDCLHTFCSSCLEGVVTPSNTIMCPMCRATYTLDEKGVRGLKVNHNLANIVQKLKSSQSIRMCIECQTSICTIFCEHCKDFLCNECNQKIHSIRSFHSHNRISFEDCFFDNQKLASPLFKYSKIMREFDCVIPFNVKKSVCEDLFREWIDGLWLAPFDFKKKIELKEFKTFWAPYWLFEVDIFSRLVGYTSAISAASVNFMRIRNLMVCAGSSSDAKLLEKVEPWKTEQLEPFTLIHIEHGTEVQPFSLDSEQAWNIRGRTKIEKLNLQECQKRLRSSAHSEKEILSNCKVDSTFSGRKARRVFVPIYMTSYLYHGKEYEFIVNGSTARVYGSRPYSTTKLVTFGIGGGISAAFGLSTRSL